MHGVAREERERLETIEGELVEVKRHLDRIWQVIETTDIEMADASERIREHRDAEGAIGVRRRGRPQRGSNEFGTWWWAMRYCITNF
jgi:hypothetical protein